MMNRNEPETNCLKPESKASVVERIIMCQCGNNPATEPHSCPYAEANDNSDPEFCTCCDDCRHDCCMDI